MRVLGGIDLVLLVCASQNCDAWQRTVRQTRFRLLSSAHDGGGRMVLLHGGASWFFGLEALRGILRVETLVFQIWIGCGMYALCME